MIHREGDIYKETFELSLSKSGLSRIENPHQRIVVDWLFFDPSSPRFRSPVAAKSRCQPLKRSSAPLREESGDWTIELAPGVIALSPEGVVFVETTAVVSITEVHNIDAVRRRIKKTQFTRSIAGHEFNYFMVSSLASTYRIFAEPAIRKVNLHLR